MSNATVNDCTHACLRTYFKENKKLDVLFVSQSKCICVEMEKEERAGVNQRST